MERTGTITAVSGDTLEVTFCRPGDCEKCHACIGGEKKHVLLVKGEGHVGDVAVVSLPEQTVVKASALAYLLPLAGLFIGMLLGALVAERDGGQCHRRCDRAGSGAHRADGDGKEAQPVRKICAEAAARDFCRRRAQKLTLPLRKDVFLWPRNL